jgi:hypothetical protein
MKPNNEQIEKYRKHLTFFATETTPLCDLFLELLEASHEAHLECSCKIADNTVYPLRFNLWYKNNGESTINPKIVTFLKNCAQISPLNLSLYQNLSVRIFNMTK